MLDAEEFDDEDTSTADLRIDKADGMRGLKMRRCSLHAQINEEIEDDETEASLAKKLLEGSYFLLCSLQNRPLVHMIYGLLRCRRW